MGKIQVRFDNGPGFVGGRFIEVEDATGAGIKIGEWVRDVGDEWLLVFDDPRQLGEIRNELNTAGVKHVGQNLVDRIGALISNRNHMLLNAVRRDKIIGTMQKTIARYQGVVQRMRDPGLLLKRVAKLEAELTWERRKIAAAVTALRAGGR